MVGVASAASEALLSILDTSSFEVDLARYDLY
jgi:hypothetical protein